jgi:CBS domain-containing protein
VSPLLIFAPLKERRRVIIVTRNQRLSFAEASVASIMTTDVKTIGTAKPLVECIKMMKDANIGCIVVIDEGRPVGIFTERDLVRRMAEKLENLGSMMAQVMTKPLFTISPTASVWDALIQMGRHDIRRLPVMEGRKLVGIVTERDVFRLILAEQSLLLESVSEAIPASTREKIKGVTGALGIEKPPLRVQS